MTTTHGTRIDLVSPETFVIVGVNSNMAQNVVVALRYDDVTIGAAFEPPSSIAVRPGQNVSSTLQLTGVFPELKNLDVEWDYSDGSPKDRMTLPASGTVRLERSHAWSKSGSFTVRASVFDTDHPSHEICFLTRQITVQPVKVEISALETKPQTQDDVRFSIKASGPLPEAPQYRVNFGDGSDPLLALTPEISHRYANAGQYTVLVELLAALAPSDVIANSKTVLNVRAADVPSPASAATVQAASGPDASSSASVQ